MEGYDVVECLLGDDLPRFVEARGVDLGGADLDRDLPDHVGLLAAAEQQFAAGRLVQRGEAVVEPPALRRAHGVGVRYLVVFENIERGHRAGRGGRGQRMVVGDPQIAAEPHQRRRGHQQVVTLVWRRKVPRVRRAG